MAYKTACKLCNNLIISQSVTVITVNGTDTLVIDLPLRTYGDHCKYCIVIAQTIPTVATINMPVAFSINGVTTTVYPFVRCDCSQITACGIRTRTKYPIIVSTNSTGGVFKSLGGISCCPNNNLASLPVTTTTVTPAAVQLSAEVENSTQPKTTRIVTNTTKEVISHE